MIAIKHNIKWAVENKLKIKIWGSEETVDVEKYTFK